MTTPARTARLAGEPLVDHRHVCVLLDGPDEAESLLMPFIVDGFEEGDRAFHMIDPALRDAHIEGIRASGVDIEAAGASHQLEVRTWTESYLRGGKFDGSAQLEYVQEALDAGRRMGFPRTRLIGSTEWALDDESARDLIRYEAGVDEYLSTVPDVAVCTYDLTRHNARVIAEVISAHPVALIGGMLRMNRGAGRVSARDRLLTAASQLFPEAGVQATGVDAIIGASGAAKATFYRHFPSKDDLIVAWLRDPRTRWFDHVRAEAERPATDPREEILLFFEAVARWLESDGSRGCPYLNTAVEITDPAHPARTVVREYLDEISAYLRMRLVDAGYPDADRRAMELHTLLTGAISLAVAHQTSAFAIAARRAAERLLDRP
jgi:AcrR family transcriptional regulator